mmetsp:Transcript_5983/g.8705  ORF Transcript_5983/g.8705 Transcript_5983/m.8705 type:complete len:560 (-) Transcript_5983:73-1752(-)
MSAAFRARIASSAIHHHSQRRRSGKILLSSSRALLPSVSLLNQPKYSSVQLHHSSSSLHPSRLHNEAQCHCKIQACQISSTTFVQKSAMPLPDDCDNDTSFEGSTNTTPFLLADIGEGISEVELLQWYVNPGDTVSQFDRICEVQSDKATVEITSRFDGIVERLCGNVGEMMFVGKPLLYIAVDGVANVSGGGGGAQQQHVANESVDEIKQQAMLHDTVDENDRLHTPISNDESIYSNENLTMKGEGSGIVTKVLSSPAVRKMSKDYDIDLGAVMGTGPAGRVLKADMLKAISAKDSTAKQSGSTTITSQVSSASPLGASQREEDTVVPIRGYNRLMVKSMTTSLQVPHMVYADEININALTEVRDTLRPLAKEMGIPKLTYLPFFMKASSLAIVKYPVLNSTIDVEEMTLTYHDSHNIGVAMDTERGLTVPVVKRCQDKSVMEIAEELARLHYLAFEGNLSEADINDCTFTLSNIGAIGGTYMSPVVLPPQVVVGAMGKIQRLPRFVSDTSDEVESARIMPISWGGDHRAVDGATMARFSNLFKSYVENPSSMMFAMR